LVKPLGSDILQIAEMLIGVREPPFVARSIKRAEGKPTVGYNVSRRIAAGHQSHQQPVQP
jgi:hypothetical protein